MVVPNLEQAGPWFPPENRPQTNLAFREQSPVSERALAELPEAPSNPPDYEIHDFGDERSTPVSPDWNVKELDSSDSLRSNLPPDDKLSATQKVEVTVNVNLTGSNGLLSKVSPRPATPADAGDTNGKAQQKPPTTLPRAAGKERATTGPAQTTMNARDEKPAQQSRLLQFFANKKPLNGQHQAVLNRR